VENSAEGIIGYKNGVKTNFWITSTYCMDSPITIELICEKGIAQISGDQASIFFHNGDALYADGKQRSNASSELDGQGKDYWGTMHGEQIADFYHHLATGEGMLVEAQEVLKTQKMVDMIYRSGRENQRIYI
jgi:predicted dehydrogenase